MPNAILDATAIPEGQVVLRTKSKTLLGVPYVAALLVSISIWFLAVRAPLWVDETLSYWQIAGGFKQIWTRSIQGNSFAAYAYLLWLTKTLFGSSELVLRIPSILAMLAAVYVFYRCARELFDWDVSLIATIFFILPRGIAFAAIDVRPYGFALLATNLTILLFLRWMNTKKTADAAWLGVVAAGIFYFHYLFACVLVALAIDYLLTTRTSIRTDLRQIGVALGCFAIVILPVLPRLKYVYQTRTMHSFAATPQWTSVLQVLNPGTWQLLMFASVLVLAALAHKLTAPDRKTLSKLLLSLLLTLVPILSLFAISVATPVHVFIPRYLLVAIPGMALCWGWLCSLMDSRALRASFCVAFVALCVFQAYTSPVSRKHEESWKDALAFADASAAVDGAPLLMCSPLVEADYLPMPAVAAESVLYAPLSYYQVKAQVVPFPRTLNTEAERQAKQFLSTALHKRFLVLAPWQSQRIVDLLAYYSQDTHSPRVLGRFDNIWVVEFVPRDGDAN